MRAPEPALGAAAVASGSAKIRASDQENQGGKDGQSAVRRAFVQGDGTGHVRVVLQPENIAGVKVERESELHTTTRHGGRISAFSSVGLGYTFGGKSSSKTKVVERAFLELHYQFGEREAPGWVAVPFEQDRRTADSFAAAIQGMLRKQ